MLAFRRIRVDLISNGYSGEKNIITTRPCGTDLKLVVSSCSIQGLFGVRLRFLGLCKKAAADVGVLFCKKRGPFRSSLTQSGTSVRHEVTLRFYCLDFPTVISALVASNAVRFSLDYGVELANRVLRSHCVDFIGTKIGSPALLSRYSPVRQQKVRLPVSNCS
jgi:hypothetical protein